MTSKKKKINHPSPKNKNIKRGYKAKQKMKNHEITVEDLNEYKNTQEVLYARQDGLNGSKCIKITLSGNYKVYKKWECLYDGSNAELAVSTYNEILI